MEYTGVLIDPKALEVGDGSTGMSRCSRMAARVVRVDDGPSADA
jgi:hypothetical protein